jgi:hypothetical protein
MNFFTILFFQLLFLYNAIVSNAEIYSDDDGVLLLNDSNFEDAIEVEILSVIRFWFN